MRAYGTRAPSCSARREVDGRSRPRFGATLTEREVDYLMRKEWARTAEDVVWRRSKLGLRLRRTRRAALDDWMAERRDGRGARGGGMRRRGTADELWNSKHVTQGRSMARRMSIATSR